MCLCYDFLHSIFMRLCVRTVCVMPAKLWICSWGALLRIHIFTNFWKTCDRIEKEKKILLKRETSTTRAGCRWWKKERPTANWMTIKREKWREGEGEEEWESKTAHKMWKKWRECIHIKRNFLVENVSFFRSHSVGVCVCAFDFMCTRKSLKCS